MRKQDLGNFKVLDPLKNRRIKSTPEIMEQRFWAKVKKTDYCWEWMGWKQPSGHGQFGTSKKVIGAHRYSWELHNGKIPKGKCILHKCDNGSCVNPDHLFLGTQSDNIVDMHKKRRGRNILSLEEVQYVRSNYNPRKVTQDMLAKKFNVNKMTIGRILRGETYKVYE